MAIEHRGKHLATIYRKTKARPTYRVAWFVKGRRQMKSHKTYSEAKRYADDLVKKLAKGSQVTALTPGQACDALAAMERLQSFYESTGRKVSLRAGIAEFCEASGKLHGHTLGAVVELGTAVDGYLRTVASVTRKDIGEAVTEFIQASEPRTKANEGQRAQLDPKYAYNRELQLRRFANTFPNTSVCDLRKEHLTTFIGSLKEFSPKSRNHYRAAIKQFLQWSVRRDYLAVTHRLTEADAMAPERGNTAEVKCYTPDELETLLTTADKTLQPMIAIGGLAGLRTAELLRLDFADVWRVPKHIEVTAQKSKTRQRRLVQVCTALREWLRPYRAQTTGKLWNLHESKFQQHFLDLCAKAKVPRKNNGLRHSFCSAHYGANANENLTAQQAGNSPSLVHSNYKGLLTKKQGEAWFAVKPVKTAAEEKIIDLEKRGAA